MRVVVTGGAGFIGSNLCAQLLDTDGVDSVAVIDDLSNGRLVLGLVAGWQAREHEHYGIPFGTFDSRFGRSRAASRAGCRS